MIVLATTARKGRCIGIFIEPNRFLNTFQTLFVIERNTCFGFFLLFWCRKSQNIPMKKFPSIYVELCYLHGMTQMKWFFGVKITLMRKKWVYTYWQHIYTEARWDMERLRVRAYIHTTQKSKLENCSFYTHKMHKVVLLSERWWYF